jgi:hypothetical protein
MWIGAICGFLAGFLFGFDFGEGIIKGIFSGLISGFVFTTIMVCSGKLSHFYANRGLKKIERKKQKKAIIV